MDQVWFPKDLGMGSIEFMFEFAKGPSSEPTSLGLGFEGFC